MFKNLSAVVIGFVLIFCSCNQKTLDIKKTSISGSPLETLLSKMTLEEKIGQMTQFNGFWDVTGPAPTDGDGKWKYEALEKGLVGSVLNVSGAENVRKMQEVAVNSRLGIPLIFGLDVIHGHKTLSPIPLAEAASWDLEAIEKSARIAAVEASSRGINWTFAPMVDISRDARWGRVMEGGGEDPYLGSKIGVARVRGFQGTDLSDHTTLAATAKHFVGYGFAEAGRDYNTVDVGTSTLYNVMLPPFQAIVDEGVCTVMNAFNVLNGIPATADKFLQRDILKGKWGFDGFVVSDWGSGVEMIAHGYAKDLKDVAVLSTNAGSDMDMESYANIKHLKEAVNEGLVDISTIDDAVLRILKVKEKLGLFDDPFKYCDSKREENALYHDDHKKAALDLAKKSCVLLKNDDQFLPLAENQEGIAVIGALADDKTSPLGSWRIGSDDNTAISVIEGLQNHNIDYTYQKGADVTIGETTFIKDLTINETDKSGFDKALALAKKSKVIIMVLGEHGFQSGEARSRTKLGLPGVQQELLEAVHKVNPNIVLVVNSGRPLVLSWADENIPAILQAWQLGTESGNAIVELLFGKYNPSGKLPMTFPRSEGQVPIYYNHLNTGRPGPSDMVFWTHYMDESNTPLYPFGHGLSYTDFEYSNLEVNYTSLDSSKVNVEVQVKNSGDRKGTEVVQLYIRDKVATVSRPVKELKGFELVNLEAGEMKTVTLQLTDKELGFYDNQGKYVVEKGEFEVFIGGSSETVLNSSFHLK